jgi:spore coat protein U-like protein
MLSKKWNARMLAATGTTVLVLGATSATHAGTNTADLPVQAHVAANCAISTVTVDFGTYDPAVVNKAAAKDATGTVNVTCTSGASTTITLSEGDNKNTGSSVSVPLRRMTDDGTNFLSYFLYSENTRTTVWGDDAGSGLAHTGTGSQVALTVYGRITANQQVPTGDYTDTVVATVTF